MKILVVNTGSTSTKVADYLNKTALFVTNLRHSVEELSVFPTIMDQFDFRKQLVLNELNRNGIALQFDVVIGRGGLVKPIPGGVYEVNEAMKRDTLNAMRTHACNLGGLIARDLASSIPGCHALIADPGVVDELDDVARVTGSPLLPRISIFHALNHKAVGRRYAANCDANYEDLNLIICHLGGGISVAAHRKGRAVDVNNALDGEGPFSPERAGTLPAGSLIDLCYSGRFSREELKNRISGQAGLAAHLGTTDVPEVISMIEAGDKHAELVLNAMVYNVIKSIGAQSAVLKGQVDAIILTGGIAHSDYVVSRIKESVSYIAPVVVYPGEDEMEALAMSAYEALNGILPINDYK